MDELSAAALAATASSALLQAMLSDVWPAVKQRAALILGRADGAAESRVDRAMEDSRGRVLAAAPERRNQVLVLEAARWEGRLLARLDEEPGFADTVRELIAAIQAAGGPGHGSTTVGQHVTAGRDAYVAGRDLTVGTPEPAP